MDSSPRFIPRRNKKNSNKSDIVHYYLTTDTDAINQIHNYNRLNYINALDESLFGGQALSIIERREKLLSQTTHNTSTWRESERNKVLKRRKELENIQPFRVLDAPSARDDWYTNPLDLCQQSHELLSISCDDHTYYYNIPSSTIVELPKSRESISTKFIGSDRISFSNANKEVIIIDIVTLQLVGKTTTNYKAFSLDYSRENSTLAIGTAGLEIGLWDIRTIAKPENILSIGGCYKVCGLKFHPRIPHLLASGDGSGAMKIWDIRMIPSNNEASLTVYHDSSVKAMSWSPHSDTMIATGSGTDDKCVRIINTATTGEVMDKFFMGCSVHGVEWWNNELIVAYGNDVKVFACSKHLPDHSRELRSSLISHDYRILQMATSAGSRIVTLGADECIKICDIPSPFSTKTNNNNTPSSRFSIPPDIR